MTMATPHPHHRRLSNSSSPLTRTSPDFQIHQSSPTDDTSETRSQVFSQLYPQEVQQDDQKQKRQQQSQGP
jgi:hypothetical protein